MNIFLHVFLAEEMSFWRLQINAQKNTLIPRFTIYLNTAPLKIVIFI